MAKARPADDRRVSFTKERRVISGCISNYFLFLSRRFTDSENTYPIPTFLASL
jgi:hypothetical protein